MTSTTDMLASALLEIQGDLGNLVVLLKEEQQTILQRRTDQVMPLMARIEDQLVRVRQQQARCDEMLQGLLVDAPKPEKPGLAARVALLPENIREHPLAIAERVDSEMLLVHEFAWQNHVLLSHSVHFLEEVLAPWLNPQNDTLALYGKNGLVQKNMEKQTLFQAIA